MGPFRGPNTKGSAVVAVGVGCKFPPTQIGLQNAINEVISRTHFIETDYSGETVSCTKDTNVVIGVGTNWTTDFDGALTGKSEQFMSLTGTAARKWHRVRTVIDDTHILLDYPYRDATVADVAYQTATPIIHTIEIYDDIDITDISANILYINSDGTAAGVAVDGVNIILKWMASSFFRGQFSTDANSGMVVVDGLDVRSPSHPRFHGANTDAVLYPRALEFIFRNTDIESYAGIINSNSDQWAIVRIENNSIKHRHNGLLPSATGSFNVKNNTISVASRFDTQSIAEVTAVTVGLDLDTNASIIDNTINATVDGDSGTNGHYGFRLRAPYTGLFPGRQEGIGINISNLDLFFNHDADAIATTNFTAIEVSYMRGADIYLANVNVQFVGDPVIVGAAWKMFSKASIDTFDATVKNKLRVINCRFLDLPNDWTTMELVELVGDMGTKSLTYALALDVAEIDPLRGSTFTLDLTGDVTTVPAPAANGPAGHEITFLFTQDATGGRTIAAAAFDPIYKLSAGYVDGSTAAAGTSTEIKFKFNGTSYVMVGGANEWL